MPSAPVKADILRHALALAPFEGWTQGMLTRAAHAAGYREANIHRVFPNGVAGVLEYWLEQADMDMNAALAAMNLPALRHSQRVRAAVLWRLHHFTSQREAIRRALAVLALPQHAGLALRALYRTVDAIWHAAGDYSTDFNFYTKRATLAAIYMATLRFWLNDDSEEIAATEEFLDRRLADVARFAKTKATCGKFFTARPGMA